MPSIGNWFCSKASIQTKQFITYIRNTIKNIPLQEQNPLYPLHPVPPIPKFNREIALGMNEL